ncbi:hypothetical protein Q5424_01320 [Conexibacter sp. JD483]|uniref:hypothetical protein n=1 Tax=unclassified Conexibacter TaxID=2627773 RepID=UPI0027280D29|nr:MULTISPECIES: hypothetical protein [unclassified Conexibacter]MDO8185870.1 hypothetical protein [Conexibacter sp. CPCC 205706]MDO8198613.1 hypothetical protein [Conexibacter sp. CPCC 205762]MDR9367699.1 hypothetical protein [Conexibacter sp. JD483]
MALALVIAAIAVLLGAHSNVPGAPSTGAAPRLYDLRTGPPPPPARTHPAPRASIESAHQFARDYLETLLGARSPRRVRHATERLKTDIALAGLRAPAGTTARDLQVQIRARRITAEVVGVRGVAHAEGYVAHLSFLITKSRSGWAVDTLADPDDPAG